MLNDWSHKVRAILKNIARAILKKYCPPHKARGIHDFILATKSSVWIIIKVISVWEVSEHQQKSPMKLVLTCMVCFKTQLMSECDYSDD